MGLMELFLIAVGLSMDAFAVSVCKGLSLGKINVKHMAIAGLWFGGFQGLMPAIGYFFGSFFTDFINAYAHWIAFGLLCLIGGNMIKESMSKEQEEMNASMAPKTMFLLAVATSIDAMAVGVSFAFMQVQIVWAVIFIGCITFCLSAVGVKVGSIFGVKYKSKAELTGGLVLIAIGLKILIEGLLK
ncbi:MAG: manganese efflux pump [Lachnospiraceae bacterium]|nr:manganese efflux pump [Lachnospiraceae bacterium]